MTWRELYNEASAQLGDRQAARWFVEEASGGEWPSVLGELVPDRAGQVFASLVRRRQGGEPVQYVLGHWAFRSLDLMVDKRALIPRPETEVVVEVALRELERLGPPAPLVVDLGTGSGAIALSVAAERPAATVWAADASAGALQVASANLAALGARGGGRAQLVQGSWWGAFPEDLRGLVDLAISNPPYIAAAERESLPPEVSDWEPLEALVAGPTGLEAFEAILGGASKWLKPRSALVLEMAPSQVGPLAGLARGAGFSEVEVVPDLAGHERVLVARRDAHSG
ncbi:MAG TPA: peptide chain release factor N(5)-glutamine methyltransferase [Acidimicrobiales bacterium]|nr:peptide chain release factor N(5)-glutamine methyltransferase [Acidimicrobiales bacterium]